MEIERRSSILIKKRLWMPNWIYDCSEFKLNKIVKKYLFT